MMQQAVATFARTLLDALWHTNERAIQGTVKATSKWHGTIALLLRES